MLLALIHGKLSRNQENMEDILTSNVFGAFQYLSAGELLLKFLSKASSLDGKYPLVNLSLESRLYIEFWPWLSEAGFASCEPDVLIRIDPPEGDAYLVLIEAKYRSGKSSEREATDNQIESNEPVQNIKDQLAREWQQLMLLAGKETRTPVLIYLTADGSYPYRELIESQNELRVRTEHEGMLCWLSWRHLAAILVPKQNTEMLADLLRVLRKLNLTFFEGFSPLQCYELPSWHFRQEPSNSSRRFSWNMISMPTYFDWRFTDV
jgi:hypothetical protein